MPCLYCFHQTTKWVHWYKWLLKTVEDDTKLLDLSYIPNEAWFHCSEHVNFQSICVGPAESSQATRETPYVLSRLECICKHPTPERGMHGFFYRHLNSQCKSTQSISPLTPHKMRFLRVVNQYGATSHTSLASGRKGEPSLALRLHFTAFTDKLCLLKYCSWKISDTLLQV